MSNQMSPQQCTCSTQVLEVSNLLPAEVAVVLNHHLEVLSSQLALLDRADLVPPFQGYS